MTTGGSDALDRANEFLSRLALPNTPRVQGLNLSKGASYESYVVALILWSIQDDGWQLSLKQLGMPIGTGGPMRFLVRGAPGPLQRQFSYAACMSASGTTYNTLLNVQYEGGS